MFDRLEHTSSADRRLAYLQVDAFLDTVVGARALASGFELGLIDALASGRRERSQLAPAIGLSHRALALLTNLLCAGGILWVSPDGERLALTQGFEAALAYRDLMETKLEFCFLLLPDLAGSFTKLLLDPMGFMASSRVFDLFRYDRCLEPTAANLAATRHWMRLTTVLTRYEAPVCLDHYDCGAHTRVLDVGGNSGELMRQLCRRHAQVQATVFDLPVVCRIGEEHVAGSPEASRITFQPGDALNDPLPMGHDLICFKSMLHDWPEEEALRLLSQAVRALAPGGGLLIFERGPLEPGGRMPGFAQIPVLLFGCYYRSPMFYARALEGLGLTAIDLVRVELDQPFYLITAHKPR